MENEFTEKELAILEEAHLRSSQLRNLRRVLAQPMPRKKKMRVEAALPGYIQRDFNATQKGNKVMEKYGYEKKTTPPAA